MNVSRFIGWRNENFQLRAFVDSNKEMHGITVYVLNEGTKDVNFITGPLIDKPLNILKLIVYSDSLIALLK